MIASAFVNLHSKSEVNMTLLEKKLLAFLPRQQVKTSLLDRLSYASDAGFYQMVPQAVVISETVEQIRKLFALSAEMKVPIVFRAAGTSLSGQSITDGVLVDVAQHWRKITVSDNRELVTVQPGITGGMVNNYLKKYNRKIGPDPASINAAMMGGIISNNASGMCCGVAYNSYHTLQSIRFVLPDGKDYDTANSNDYNRFLSEQHALCETLTATQRQISANENLHERIRRKYRTKNTVGYSLNALIDFQHPLDMFAHLLVGAEGTLAFIAEATMLTLPDKPFKAAAMLYFPGIYEACQAIVPLKETGADALELMDRASLRSVEHLPGLPDFFRQLPDGAAALLCEYQAESREALDEMLATAKNVLHQLPLLREATFTTDEKERGFYWKLRKGMFPSVGAVRKRGTTVILEDIAFPVEQLANALIDLQDLFRQFNYENAIIFGHAKDGNIHFVVTQLLDTPQEIERYDRFLNAVVDLVVHKYDGALKAEHGTGRNMAPFVETEWGGEAYAIMKAIKAAADPANLLNPGVIINNSNKAHIENLKDLPQVEAEVDKCIECGFCEPSCPSRDLTMTPRRRIVARRALQRLRKQGYGSSEKTLLQEYNFDGLDTCATDGLCASECPVNINTGELVKRLRHEKHGTVAKSIASAIANHYAIAEKVAKPALQVISLMDRFAGLKLITKLTHGLRKLFPSMPVWMHQVKAARRLPTTTQRKAEVIYFTSCINRVMDHQPASEKSLQQIILDLCNKAGIMVVIPKSIAGHCCGQPFTSKGFFEAGQQILIKTVDALLQWTDNGRIPVMIDFSSCTYTFMHYAHLLPETYQQKFARLKLVDSVEYLEKAVLPKIFISNKQKMAVLHPACALTKLNLRDALERVAKSCAEDVIVPAYAGCCGMAGDRGFLVPELVASAERLEAEEVKEYTGAKCYSSSTTCEMSLTNQTGKPYRHIAYLVNEATS